MQTKSFNHKLLDHLFAVNAPQRLIEEKVLDTFDLHNRIGQELQITTTSQWYRRNPFAPMLLDMHPDGTLMIGKLVLISPTSAELLEAFMYDQNDFELRSFVCDIRDVADRDDIE